MNREAVNGGASSPAHQGNSYEASPTQQTELELVQIIFTEEEQAEIRTEISRLSMLSVICQVVGARPNSGEMKDLLQAVCEGHWSCSRCSISMKRVLPCRA